ncbi:hypothetical protein ACSSV1_005080 [Labrenzia sp. MBR-25]|jgi:hypothetical protein
MLKLNGVPLNLIKDFRGREGTSETGIRFANPADLPLLTDLQSNYPIVTGHLAWRPIWLLGVIEANQPAPWFEDPDKKRGRRRKRTTRMG